MLHWQMGSGDQMHVAASTPKPQLPLVIPPPGLGEHTALGPAAVAAQLRFHLHS